MGFLWQLKLRHDAASVSSELGAVFLEGRPGMEPKGATKYICVCPLDPVSCS